jgi:(2Fe-2S) ferredoxin
MKYQHHIFVCTNEREGKKSCTEAAGLQLLDAFKSAIKEKGITGVRAQRAGCLDLCKHGPAAMVYPTGTCYGNLTPESALQIVEEHISGGIEVAQFKLDY